jgi:hypothetical protein
MQLYFTVVFGVVIGMLSACKSSKIIDKSAEEHDTFLKKAKERMLSYMTSDWKHH